MKHEDMVMPIIAGVHWMVIKDLGMSLGGIKEYRKNQYHPDYDKII